MYLILLLGLASFYRLAAQDVIPADGTTCFFETLEGVPDRYGSLSALLAARPEYEKDILLDDYDAVTHYWVRFTVRAEKPGDYFLYLYPDLNNTLYSPNEKGNWTTSRSGKAVADGRMVSGNFAYTFRDTLPVTFYAHLDVRPLEGSTYWLNARGGGIAAETVRKGDQLVFSTWIATIAVILMFFFYNAYLGYLFRDRTYLWYLLMLVGVMMYITSYRSLLNQLFDARLYKALAAPPGLYTFDLNTTLMQLAMAATLTGFVYYSRAYLETKLLFPMWDRFLVRLNAVLVVLLMVSAVVTQSGMYYSYIHSNTAANLIIVVLFVLVFVLAFRAARKGLKQARYFLIANTVPMLLTMTLTLWFVFLRTNRGPEYLPNVAIMLQVLSLAVALVARVNLIKEELRRSELEASLLRKDNEQILLKHQLVAMENQYMNAEMSVQRAEKEKLQEKLEFNQRELASATMYMYQKNEMLSGLQKQLDHLPKATQHDAPLQEIKSIIRNNQFLDADWEKFRLHFEQVHPDFFRNLKKEHPDLTPNEIRLCAYFHMNLSAKEIAGLLNINPTSVHRAKLRLNNKLRRSEN